METTKLSSKGQVVIPSVLRKRHGWSEGQEFEVEDLEDGLLLRPKRIFAVTRLEDVAGCLPYSGPVISLSDMDAAIEKAVREKEDDRG